ncbi:hypothetical protein HPP92_006657, partial [Vanilla planifolia]
MVESMRISNVILHELPLIYYLRLRIVIEHQKKLVGVKMKATFDEQDNPMFSINVLELLKSSQMRHGLRIGLHCYR